MKYILFENRNFQDFHHFSALAFSKLFKVFQISSFMYAKIFSGMLLDLFLHFVQYFCDKQGVEGSRFRVFLEVTKMLKHIGTCPKL